MQGMMYYAFVSQRGTQSRIYSQEEVPSWDSEELHGFENIAIGTEEECQAAIDDEFNYRQEES